MEVCPLCSSCSIELFKNIRYYGIDFARCLNCNLVYMIPLADEEAWLKFAVAAPNSTDHRKEAYCDSKQVLFRNGLKQIRSILSRSGHEFKSGRPTLLDIGCGEGYFLKIAGEEGWRVQGVELSDIAVNVARTTFGLKIHNRPIRSIGFPSDSFDVVTGWGVINFFRFPLLDLKEIHRITASGGVICLRMPNGLFHWVLMKVESYINFKLQRRRFLAQLHAYNYSSSTVRKILKMAGFDEIRCFNSQPTMGDPYGSGKKADKILIMVMKNSIYFIALIVQFLSFGKLLIGSSIIVYARKPASA
jgi:2-polyprenyl-3-methyl-5-hydroxy-6-metoxy-1,4-benzoquinol methylase